MADSSHTRDKCWLLPPRAFNSDVTTLYTLRRYVWCCFVRSTSYFCVLFHQGRNYLRFVEDTPDNVLIFILVHTYSVQQFRGTVQLIWVTALLCRRSFRMLLTCYNCCSSATKQLQHHSSSGTATEQLPQAGGFRGRDYLCYRCSTVTQHN